MSVKPFTFAKYMFFLILTAARLKFLLSKSSPGRTLKSTDAIKGTFFDSPRQNLSPELSSSERELLEIFIKDGHHDAELQHFSKLLERKYAMAKHLADIIDQCQKNIVFIRGKLQTSSQYQQRTMNIELVNHQNVYRESLVKLRSLKNETGHLRHGLEQTKIKLIQKFRDWYDDITHRKKLACSNVKNCVQIGYNLDNSGGSELRHSGTNLNNEKQILNSYKIISDNCSTDVITNNKMPLAYEYNRFYNTVEPTSYSQENESGACFDFNQCLNSRIQDTSTQREMDYSYCFKNSSNNKYFNWSANEDELFLGNTLSINSDADKMPVLQKYNVPLIPTIKPDVPLTHQLRKTSSNSTRGRINENVDFLNGKIIQNTSSSDSNNIKSVHYLDLMSSNFKDDPPNCGTSNYYLDAQVELNTNTNNDSSMNLFLENSYNDENKENAIVNKGTTYEDIKTNRTLVGSPINDTANGLLASKIYPLHLNNNIDNFGSRTQLERALSDSELASYNKSMKNSLEITTIEKSPNQYDHIDSIRSERNDYHGLYQKTDSSGFVEFMKTIPLTGDPEIDEEIFKFYRSKFISNT